MAKVLQEVVFHLMLIFDPHPVGSQAASSRSRVLIAWSSISFAQRPDEDYFQ